MVLCVHDNPVFVVILTPVEAGIVEAPVDEAIVFRRWHIQHLEWIDVCVHPMLVLLWHVDPFLRGSTGFRGIADASFLRCSLHGEIACGSIVQTAVKLNSSPNSLHYC